MVKLGDEIELRVEKFADQGKCLSRLAGFVVFVEGTVPGERVRVLIRKKKKNYAEAKLLSVLEKSPVRVEPPCLYFGTCNGCKWQHVAYEYQLEAKRQSVQDALTHLGGFKVTANPAIASPNVYGYRNKMEFSFSAHRWLTEKEIESGEALDTTFALGFHARGQFSSVINIKECLLQRSPSSEILNAVREIARQKGWTAWDTRKKTGFLRHLVIRIAEQTAEIMVNLVTNSYSPERMALLAKVFQTRFPEVTTLVNTINTGVAQVATGEELRIIYGPGVIHDAIGNYRFAITPNTFFQPNTKQAERLYEIARDFAELKPGDLLYDLYCGAGTISIFVSSSVRKAVGVELAEEAVENAYANARANGVTNCTFVCGDVMRMFTPEFVNQYGRPDVMIVDPPRAGMHRKVVEHIAHLKPSRLVYVSCNPMTQMQDVALLRDLYTIEAVQPVDLFPQTHHIETVLKLTINQRD